MDRLPASGKDEASAGAKASDDYIHSLQDFSLHTVGPFLDLLEFELGMDRQPFVDHIRQLSLLIS